MSQTLQEAFFAYERALMTNDVAELDRLFAPGPTTLRGDAKGLLVGHDQISAFRGGRKVAGDGKPWRRIVQTHVQTIDDDHALIVAVTALASGGRGQQTQLWNRIDGEWKVTAAHVSVPAPALDTSIWQIVGDPAAPAIGTGVLDGEMLAVPAPFNLSGPHVEPVSTVLAKGAAVRGIAHSPAAAIAAVSQGHATFALSPNGEALPDVWSFRTTAGLLGSLSGWSTRSPELLAKVAGVLLRGYNDVNLPLPAALGLATSTMEAEGPDAAFAINDWVRGMGRSMQALNDQLAVQAALGRGLVVVVPNPTSMNLRADLPLATAPVNVRGGGTCTVGLVAAPGRDREVLALAAALAS